MKKQFLFLLLCILASFTGKAQSSISFTTLVTTVKVGTVLTVNYKYTATTNVVIDCALNLQDNWTWISYIGGRFETVAAGTDLTGTFSFIIPAGTTPSDNLTGTLNYKIKIEMKNASTGAWIAGAYPANQIQVTIDPFTYDNGPISIWPSNSSGVGIGTGYAKSKLDVKGNLTVGRSYAGINAAPTNGAIIEGNVGIGITTPIEKLQVNGTVLATSFKKQGALAGQFLMADGTTTTSTIANNIYTANGTLSGPRTITMGANPINFNGTGNYIINAGYVGIGTTTPTEKLVVRGDGARIKIESSSSPLNFYAYLESKYDAANPFNIVVQGTQMFGSKNIGIGSTPDTYVSGNYGIAFATQTKAVDNANVRMYLTQAGNLGIGTTHPDEKLTVKGKIHAEEIKVDLAVPADYVFQKYYTGKSELKSDYSLPTLAEIESFTKENHHLPNVPSAREIQQSGLPLGEMSNILLQKVEELTLYAIKQNKELERLKTENESYKSLAERLSALEKELKK